MNREYSWVDSLKGIAMLGVIAVHSGAGALPSVFGRIGLCGKYGVQLFYVISAMLAYASYERNIQKKGSAFKWVARKLLYCLPPFYIVVFLNLLFVGGFPDYYSMDESVTVWNILSHLTLTMGFFPKYVNSILGLEWYLGVVVTFWVLVPICYRVIRSESAALIAVIISTLFFDILDEFKFLLIPSNADEYVHKLYWGQFSIFSNLPTLFIGVLVYYLFRKKDLMNENIESDKSKIKLSITFYVIFLIVVTGLVFDASRVFLIPNTLIWTIGFVMLIFAETYYSCPLINNPLFRIIGKNTYCIYLMHYFLIIMYDRYIIPTGEVIIYWIVKYVVVIVLSLAVSVLYTRYVDGWYKMFCNRLLGIEKCQI